MKLGEILNDNFKVAFLKILNADMEITKAFELRGFLQKMNEEATKFEAIRVELLKKYGKKNKDGTLKQVENQVEFKSDEARDKFLTELQKLYNVVLDYVAPKVVLADIQDLPKEIKIKVADLLHLESVFPDLSPAKPAEATAPAVDASAETPASTEETPAEKTSAAS